jgi:hypothetical protein
VPFHKATGAVFRRDGIYALKDNTTAVNREAANRYRASQRHTTRVLVFVSTVAGADHNRSGASSSFCKEIISDKITKSRPVGKTKQNKKKQGTNKKQQNKKQRGPLCILINDQYQKKLTIKSCLKLRRDFVSARTSVAEV